MTVDLDEPEMARLTAEVERLQQIQAEMQREFAKEIKAARCEAERWRVLCGEWKQVIIDLQDKLQKFEDREPAFQRLFNAVSASPEPLCGEIAAAFYALREQEFGA